MKARSRLWLIVVALLAVYLAWGSTYLGIRIAIEGMPPWSMGFTRFVIAGVLLILLGALRREPWPTALEWRNGAIAGMLFLVIGNGAIMFAERTVPSGMAALLSACTPLVLALLELARKDGERPGRAGAAGLVLGFVGVAVLMAPALTGGASLGKPSDAALLLIAPVSWALGTVYCRANPLPTGLLMGSGVQALAAGIGDGIAALACGEVPVAIAHPPDLATWGAIGYLIVVGSFIGFTSFAFLVREVPPSLSSSNSYVNPVVAVILGTSIKHEPVTPSLLAGSALVVGAVFLLAWAQISSRRTRTTT